jgi:cell division GTPase FtsZ
VSLHLKSARAQGSTVGLGFGVGTGSSCVLREVLDEKRVVVVGLARRLWSGVCGDDGEKC